MRIEKEIGLVTCEKCGNEIPKPVYSTCNFCGVKGCPECLHNFVISLGVGSMMQKIISSIVEGKMNMAMLLLCSKCVEDKPGLRLKKLISDIGSIRKGEKKIK